MSSLAPDADSVTARHHDWQTMGLVGAAHSMSHFYQLVIPSLFVPLAAAFQLDYTELGLVMTVFFVMSGLGQAMSGFVVDKVGARRVLWFGLGSFVLASVLLSAASSYAFLLLAALVAGAGNSVFHPVDYAILNHRISQPRLGQAFSIHLLTGSLGWALAPVFISTITVLAGWRVAALGAGILCAVVLLICVIGRSRLDDRVGRHTEPAHAAQATPVSSRSRLWQLLRMPTLWGAFLFFAATAAAMSGIQNFAIPILGKLYQLPEVLASSVLSSYMLASAAGVFIGGFLVSVNPRTELTIAAALVLSGSLLVVVSLGLVPAGAVALLLVCAGFCSGMAGPSRDMLIRRVTPKGAVGSVYGLVYSGMDVGAALAPIAYGMMLDAGQPSGPWLGAAGCLVAAAVLANTIAWMASRSAARQSTATA